MTIINNPIDGQPEQYLYCSLDEQGDELTGACCLSNNPEFIDWAEKEQASGFKTIRLSVRNFIDRLNDEGFDVDGLLNHMETTGMKVH